MPTQTRKRGHRGGVLRGATGVLGELFITLGVVLLLFVAWELWWTNLDADRRQEAAATEVVREFAVPDTADSDPAGRAPAGIPGAAEKDPAEASAADRKEFGEPPPARAGEPGETFGMMYVPRFGADYARPMTHGVGLDVLNSLGIGHYPDTQMPGEDGNFAVAGHRQTHGQVFWDIDKLREGDRIYVQTGEGFYTYAYRATEIVHPEQTDVLLPVPHRPGAVPAVSTLTMTSCDPPFTTRMRIVAYLELESWRPADAGPPAPIARTVAATLEG